MTRIISGALGGRRLEVPTGASTRPTTDRVREALFSRLDHLGVLTGVAVLDLYAGSGALGLEALSRGARRATFVESDRGALEVLRRNVATLVAGAPDLGGAHTTVVADTVQRRLLRGADSAYGLVLADPPYDLDEDELADVLTLLARPGWLAPDALVVVERSARTPPPRWPAGLQPDDERRYGETRVWCARGTAAPDVA